MKLLTTLCLLGFSCSVFAQTTQPPASASTTLGVTNINAKVLTGGDHFWDLNGLGPIPGFEVPRGSGKTTIFAGSLWLGAKDQQNNLFTSTQTFRQCAPACEAGYWPGPIATIQDQAHSNKYDKIWKVARAEIQAHILLYNNPLYQIPTDIATWPGNGNTANGEAAQLAPFVDVNNDGVYSPNLGDYPKIKGDQALYLILNDKGNIKVPASPTMNAEIHVMHYGFDQPQNTAINNTVFTEYRIINRGTTNLKDFYAGIWTDFEIGRGYDDFGGCDTTTNRYYAYNSDNFDGDTINGRAFIGYGTNPPAQSVIFLDKKMTHFLQYFNSTNAVNGNPDKYNAQEYYNYLTGKWRNNALLTFGGDGSNQLSPATAFMFPGDPVTKSGWSEKTNPTTPGAGTFTDRRGVGSIGPFNLNSGQELKFTVAYNFTQGTSNLNSVTQSHQDAITVQNFFNNTVITGTKSDKVKQSLLLFPNPATDQLTIQLPSAFENKAAVISITDNVGRKVLETSVVRNSGNQAHLNISTLSKGIYQVTLTSGEETITAKLAKL